MQGPQGAQGAPGPQGDKMAIVPYRGIAGTEDEYVALACVEMPEVRFEDVVRVAVGDRRHVRQLIDHTYLKVCEEDTIEVVSAVASEPAIIGARVERNQLVIECDRKVKFVTVKLSGLRRGVTWRFRRHTKDEMDANTRFWSGWNRG